jgi:hypothetical protein
MTGPENVDVAKQKIDVADVDGKGVVEKITRVFSRERVFACFSSDDVLNL